VKIIIISTSRSNKFTCRIICFTYIPLLPVWSRNGCSVFILSAFLHDDASSLHSVTFRTFLFDFLKCDMELGHGQRFRHISLWLHLLSHHMWKKQFADLAIEVKFSPVGRPQTNPSERFMKGIVIFFNIYCFQNHRRWPELLPEVENWLNHTMADSTGFCPVEIMFNELQPDLFK